MRKLILLILFLVNSTFGGVAILNGLAHEFTVVPGGVYKGKIELQNASETLQVVTINKADMTTAFTGETFYTDSITNNRSNMNWIRVNILNVTLSQDEKRSIDFEITVPNISNLSGTYWSVIMVEPRDPIHVQQDENGYSIKSKVRYAIQIVCNIGETGNPNLQFVGISQEKHQDKNYLQVNVQNSGQLLLKPILTLELFDEEGNELPIIKSERQRIFPNSSKKYIIEINGIKPGVYQGILIADCDTEGLFGVNITLHLKDDG